MVRSCRKAVCGIEDTVAALFAVFLGKTERNVFIRENLDAKLKIQNYFHLHAPSQEEIAKVVADSNTPRAGKPEKEIEPGTKISCQIYDRTLSPIVYLISCSKQSLFKIKKYEAKRER